MGTLRKANSEIQQAAHQVQEVRGAAAAGAHTPQLERRRLAHTPQLERPTCMHNSMRPPLEGACCAPALPAAAARWGPRAAQQIDPPSCPFLDPQAATLLPGMPPVDARVLGSAKTGLLQNVLFGGTMSDAMQVRLRC